MQLSTAWRFRLTAYSPFAPLVGVSDSSCPIPCPYCNRSLSFARNHGGCDRNENLRGGGMHDGDADRRLERACRQRRFQPDMNPLGVVRVFVPLSGIRRPESVSHILDRLCGVRKARLAGSLALHGLWFAGFGRHGSRVRSPSTACAVRPAQGRLGVETWGQP